MAEQTKVALTGTAGMKDVSKDPKSTVLIVGPFDA